MSEKTIISMFFKKAEQLGNVPCFHYKEEREWKQLSWTEVSGLVRQYARGLIALGIETGMPVALMGRTHKEWTLLDCALLSIGAIVVPIYSNMSPNEVLFILKDCGARAIIVEDDSMRELVRHLHDDALPYDRVIQMEGGGADVDVITLHALVERGLSIEMSDLDSRMESVDASTVASYIYTSGTTGGQKGVVINHGNLIGEIDSIADAFDFGEGDICMVWLPQAHVLGRMAEFYLLTQGCQSAFAESIEKLARDYREVRPHFVVGVPRMLEKAYERVVSVVERKPWIIKKIFAWSVRVGEAVVSLKKKQHKPSWWLRLKYACAYAFVFRYVVERFGGRMRSVVTGGAPLSKDVASFFTAAGIQVLEGYGLTETFAAITANRVDDFELGTVGKPLKGVEIRIANDGEILVRGPMVFSEYLNSPNHSRTAFEDGWFKTGDVGFISSDGFLSITDRKKDLIITAGGKNIAPQPIEVALGESPYIDTAVVCGDRHKYLVALITLNLEAVRDFARVEGIVHADDDELHGHPDVHALIERVIAQKNERFARFETIKRFAIVPGTMSSASGDLTPTLKVRRKHVIEKYSELIESLYDN